MLIIEKTPLSRSFHTGNIGSLGQRAAKLPSVKLWELFKLGRTRTRVDTLVVHTSAVMAKAADFFLRTLTLTASDFEAL